MIIAIVTAQKCAAVNTKHLFHSGGSWFLVCDLVADTEPQTQWSQTVPQQFSIRLHLLFVCRNKTVLPFKKKEKRKPMKTWYPRRHCGKYQSLERAYYDYLDMPCVPSCRKENTGNHSYGMEDNANWEPLSVTACCTNIFVQRQRIRRCRYMLVKRWTGRHVTGYFTSDYCLSKQTESVWISN